MFIKLLYFLFKINFILTDFNLFFVIISINKGCICKFEIKECYLRKFFIYLMEICYYENYIYYIYFFWENLL